MNNASIHDAIIKYLFETKWFDAQFLVLSFWCYPWSTTHRVLKSHRSNMNAIYMLIYIYIYILHTYILFYITYIYIYLYLRIAGPSPPTKGLPPPHLLFTYFSSKNSLLRHSPRHSTGPGTSRIPSVGLNCKFFCLMRKCKKKKAHFKVKISWCQGRALYNS